MADQQQNPDTLPADFFGKPGAPAPAAKTQNPDTLPADFFSGGAGKPAPEPESPSLLHRVVGSVVDFAKGFNETANPFTKEAREGNAELMRHPLHTAKSILEAQGQLAQDAKDSFKQGDYLSGVRHAVAYLLPLVGPVIDKAGNDAAAGNVSKGLGEAAGVAAPIAAPEALKGVNLKTPTVPTSLNPVEASALQFAESRDIPVPAATRTARRMR